MIDSSQGVRQAADPAATVLDESSDAQPAAAFASQTLWMSSLAGMLAAAYAVALVSSADVRILPILLVCAGFSLTVAIVRARLKSLVWRVYLVSGLIAAGMVGVAASTSSIDILIVIATMVLPTLFTGLYLSPRRMLPTALFSVVAGFAAEWVSYSATWMRFDISSQPAIYWLVHAFVGGTMLYLLIALFIRLDNASRAARESARQLRLLYDTSRLFGATASLDEVLPTVAGNVAQILNAQTCLVMLRDPSTGAISVSAAYGIDEQTRSRIQGPPDGPSIVRTVMERREPIVIEDVGDSPLVNRSVADLTPVRSLLSLPVVSHDQVYGALVIGEVLQRRRFTTDEIARVQGLAQQIAASLRNAQLFAQTNRHLDELRHLYEMARVSAAALDSQQVMHLAAGGLMRSPDVTGCTFSRWDREADCVVTIGDYRRIDGAAAVFDEGDLGVSYGLDQYPTTCEVLAAQSVRQVRFDEPGAPAEEIALLRELGFGAVLMMPLTTPDGVFGLVELYSQDARDFSQDEVARGMAIANLATVALERARLFDAERHSHQVAETLLEVSRALGSTLDLDKLLNLILEQFQMLVPFVSASVALLDVEGKQYTLRATRGLPESLLQELLVFDVETTPTASRMVSTRRPYRITDTHAEPGWFRHEAAEHIRSWLGVPLVRNDRTIGFLMLDHDRVGFFNPEHERLAEAFAPNATIAIENAWLLDQTRRQAEHDRLVHAITSKISASIDVQTVMQTAVEELGQALGASRCLIRLGADPLNMPVAHEFHQTSIPPLAHGDVKPMLPLEDVLGNRRTSVDLRPRVDSGGALLSSAVTPIFIRGQLAGVLVLHQCDRARRWTPDEIALIEDVSAQLGIAIDNARLYSEIAHTLSDLGLLHSIAMTVASATSLPEAVNRVVESVHAATKQAYVTLLFVDKHTSDLLVSAAIGYPYDVSRVRVKLGQGVTGWVAQTGRPVLIPDVRREPRYLDAGRDPSIRSELAVPLVAGSEVVGVLNLESTQLDAFNESHLQMLTTLGSNLAMIINNLRLLDEVRAANARLQELDRLKSQFLANMSHELRTPLNSIIGFSEVLGDGLAGALSDEQREFIANIHSSGRHLLTLINDVLDLSKIDAGKLQLDSRALAPGEVIDEAGVVVAPLLARKNQELVTDLDPELPEVHADAFRLKQILINLLSNAHKFSPDGTRITLAARRDGSFVRFSVRDEGRGVRPEDHERVFQEFIQVDSGLTREQEGTGLGLPIARRLVEMHGGRIWIESTGVPGEGATFSLTIPVAAPPDPAPPAEVSAKRLPAAAPRQEEQRSVLIVEDDRQFSQLLALYFRQQGYQPITQHTGQSVLQVARSMKPVLISLDLMLPGRDGWSVLHDLKSAPDTRDIPVIIISALEYAEIGLSQGAVEYLTKPLDHEALRAVLKRIETSRHPGPYRVLVVDDEPYIIELLEAMLPQPEYVIIKAVSGPQALKAIHRALPDAVVLDLLMPGMSGIDLLELMRADPATRDLPVIVLTAELLSEVEQTRLEQAAQTVIKKADLSRQNLIDALQRLRLPATSPPEVAEAAQ